MEVIHRLSCIAVAVMLFCANAWGWGWATHRLINKEAVNHLPRSLGFFINNAQWISDHSVDADDRRSSSNPSEAPKHFIDIEDYPEFKTGTLSHDIKLLIGKYGSSTVTSIGVVPWAIDWSLDSLTESLRRGDTTNALQFAADLGHYVGDAHQPLHVTANYNGAQTGNNGIHSRYETTMMGKYLSEITVTKDQVHSVAAPIDFAFEYVTYANGLADSIMRADTFAKTLANSTSSSAYYTALWEETGAMTKKQIQNATVDLACLWYTAAVNAGLISVTSVSTQRQLRFGLHQNYPNPFNPSTTISFTLGSPTDVNLKIYNLLGEEIESLISGNRPAGTYRVEWIPNGVASGIYFYRMEAGGFVETRKLILMK
jgi:hypothetical protein